jgi:hypothetical protein
MFTVTESGLASTEAADAPAASGDGDGDEAADVACVVGAGDPDFVAAKKARAVMNTCTALTAAMDQRTRSDTRPISQS